MCAVWEEDPEHLHRGGAEVRETGHKVASPRATKWTGGKIFGSLFLDIDRVAGVPKFKSISLSPLDSLEHQLLAESILSPWPK